MRHLLSLRPATPWVSLVQLTPNTIGIRAPRPHSLVSSAFGKLFCRIGCVEVTELHDEAQCHLPCWNEVAQSFSIDLFVENEKSMFKSETCDEKRTGGGVFTQRFDASDFGHRGKFRFQKINFLQPYRYTCTSTHEKTTFDFTRKLNSSEIGMEVHLH